MKEPEIIPVINWKVFWLPILCWALLSLLTPGLVTYRAVYNYLAGHPLQVVDSWWTVAILDLFFVISGLIIFADFTRTFRTRFTSEGVEQRGILSTRFIAWRDIVSVQQERIIHLRISSSDKSIALLPEFASNWQQIATFIQSHLEDPYRMQNS